MRDGIEFVVGVIIGIMAYVIVAAAGGPEWASGGFAFQAFLTATWRIERI